MTRHTALRTFCALLVIVGLPLRIAAGQTQSPVRFEYTGLFASARLSESSGVAVSRANPGVLWTHNDSGDDPIVYATDLSGRDLGRFRVTGAEAVDWEDIAVGPCPAPTGTQSCVYVSDTGDNLEQRSTVGIYIFPEPSVTDGGLRSAEWTDQARLVHIRYSDRPRDVEALAIRPNGDVLLISKGRSGPIVVYSIPGAQLTERSVVASAIDTLPIATPVGLINQVTAAAVSNDGGILVVRTYTQLLFFRLEASGRIQAIGSPCQVGLRQPQGEGVDFLDSNWVVLTSETALGQPGGVARAACPYAPAKGP